jgi:hypothetical protein
VPDVEGVDDEVVAGIIGRKRPLENTSIDEFGDGVSNADVGKVTYANMAEWLAARDREYQEIFDRTYDDTRDDGSSEFEEDDSSSDSAASDSDESA